MPPDSSSPDPTPRPDRQPPPGDTPYVQPFNHQPVAARVPERVARGVYSTGQVVLDSPKEFVVDFLQGLTRPHQIVARVVMTPQTMMEFKNALEQNLATFTNTFGPPAPLPPPTSQQRPSLEEIYENFKIPDDLPGGVYANSVLIGHSPAEFFFDFISSFYPTSTVNARVFLPAPMVPRFVATLTTCLQQFQAKYGPRNPPRNPE